MAQGVDSEYTGTRENATGTSRDRRLGGGLLCCRARLWTEGTQHVPGINARVMTVTPIDMQGIVAHCTQADGVDLLGGDRCHHLEGIGWRLLLLSTQLATGGTWAYLTQIVIGIEALVPIIPEDAHLTLIVPLDFYRVECLTGVSHGKPLILTLSLREREGDAHLHSALSTDAPQKRLPGSQRQVF